MSETAELQEIPETKPLITSQKIKVVTTSDMRQNPEEVILKVRDADPEHEVALYHASNRYISGVRDIVRSYEMGPREYSTGYLLPNPTLSLVPVDRWGGGSVGIICYVPRREIAFPGESNEGKRISIEEDGIAYLTRHEPYLSLLDYRGEIAIGEGTNLDESSRAEIIRYNEWLAQAREKLREPREKLVAFQNQFGEVQNVLKYPLATNKVVDGTLSKAVLAFKKDFEAGKSRQEEKLNKLKDDVGKIENEAVLLAQAIESARRKPSLLTKITHNQRQAVERLRKEIGISSKLISSIYGPQSEFDRDVFEEAESWQRVMESVKRDLILQAQQLEDNIKKCEQLVAKVPEIFEVIEEFKSRYKGIYGAKDKSN